MTYDMEVTLFKDGEEWDSQPFCSSDQMSAGASVLDVLRWRDKVLFEEPESHTRIEIRRKVGGL